MKGKYKLVVIDEKNVVHIYTFNNIAHARRMYAHFKHKKCTYIKISDKIIFKSDLYWTRDGEIWAHYDKEEIC